MDELLDIAELKLDGGANVVEADDAAVLAHDFQRPIELALMVARHFEHEEIFKNIAFHDGKGQ